MDLLQCADVNFGMCVPGISNEIKCWLDHDIVVYRSTALICFQHSLNCSIETLVSVSRVVYMFLHGWKCICNFDTQFFIQLSPNQTGPCYILRGHRLYFHYYVNSAFL